MFFIARKRIRRRRISSRMRMALSGCPKAGFAHAVAHHSSPDQITILQAVQRPISVKCIQQKVPVPAWKAKPSWFLVAEEDRMIAPETQCFMAQRMGAKTRIHRVDHSPMYTAPDLVVGLILGAAEETLGQ
ncbi:MAG TPA: alpha/beta fold hydrolase [Bryobacteraceae bacterium]|nr:alpha/beta fold hydrolase [Bryobacteraceae bacterium]